MRYLGLDLGTKTLGISISDSNGVLALSYDTVRHNEDYDYLVNVLDNIINENKIEGIVLGFPKNMDNTIGERAQKTLEFKQIIEEKFNLEVILQDERLSTLEVEKFLITKDVTRSKRKKVVDKMASQVILQSYLDIMNNRRK